MAKQPDTTKRMRSPIHRAARAHLARIVPHLILAAFSLSIVLPLLWVVRVALTDKNTAYKLPPEWVSPSLNNFVEIFTKYPFAEYFLNSVWVAFFSTLISLPLSAGIAYAFARFNTGGQKLRLVILSSQMLPPVVLMLPLFSMFLAVNLNNSLTAITLSHLVITIPFLAWILVPYFQGDIAIVEQAARIDGATRFQSFRYITLPVAAPGILAAGILAFILSWNEFLFALILGGGGANTLPVGLASLQSSRGVDTALVSAGTIISIVPVIAILPMMRRHLISGLSLGAVK